MGFAPWSRSRSRSKKKYQSRSRLEKSWEPEPRKNYATPKPCPKIYLWGKNKLPLLEPFVFQICRYSTSKKTYLRRSAPHAGYNCFWRNLWNWNSQGKRINQNKQQNKKGEQEKLQRWGFGGKKRNVIFIPTSISLNCSLSYRLVVCKTEVIYRLFCCLDMFGLTRINVGQTCVGIIHSMFQFFETAIPEEGRVSLKSIFLLSKWRQEMRTNKSKPFRVEVIYI